MTVGKQKIVPRKHPSKNPGSKHIERLKADFGGEQARFTPSGLILKMDFAKSIPDATEGSLVFKLTASLSWMSWATWNKGKSGKAPYPEISLKNSGNAGSVLVPILGRNRECCIHPGPKPDRLNRHH